MSFDGLTSALVAEMSAVVFDFPAPPLQACDLVFIFGGSHPGLWQTAALAYHAGLGRTVLATGGYKPTAIHHHTWADGATPEAQVIRRELLKLGVPAAAIVVEDRSTNTLENVLFAQEVHDFSSVGSILAVCTNYGVGRQCRTLRQHIDPAAVIIPRPFETQTGARRLVITRENWAAEPESRELVFTQVRKIWEYGQRGHLAPLAKVSAQLAAFLGLGQEIG